MELQESHLNILGLCLYSSTHFEVILLALSEGDFSFKSVPIWVKDKTYTIIRDLLSEGLIIAGVRSPDFKFQPWNISPEEVIAQIEREWNELGRTPYFGDICEFEITPAGKELILNKASSQK